MSESLQTEVLVIGWGKAGKTLAGVLGRQGRSVTVVEQSAQMIGGTCINIACVPTKALVHQSQARRAGDDPSAYFRGAVHSRDTLTATLNAVNRSMLEEVDQVRLVVGARAEFTGPRQVRVTGGAQALDITADAVVINTGSVPRVLDVPGADGPRIYDSTTLQHIEPFPPRLAIVGGGPVALEFAGMFAQFGSQVTLITRGQRILTGEDDDVAESVHQALAAAGVQIRTGVDVLGMDDDGTHVDVRTSREPVAADAVLVAAGRVPATEGLALERAGIDDGPEGEVVVDAGSDEVLGGALHTVDAQELVNLIALAMRTGTTASQLRDGIWTHPSTTEALNEVLASPRD